MAFLDGILSSLPCLERDLIWSELLRRDMTDVVDEIDAMRAELNELVIPPAMPARVALSIVCAKWMLTSTVTGIRDQATRLLFESGRFSSSRHGLR